MDGRRLIEKIKLRNILSFGDKGEEIALEPLNIIIGPNASGKSNLVEVIKLLRDGANGRFPNTIINGGGISEYLWKGTMQIPKAEIESIILLQDSDLISYNLEFTRIGQQIEIIKEEIFNTKIQHEQAFYYRNKDGKAEIANWTKTIPWENFRWGEIIPLDRSKFNWQQSILSQIKDPTNYLIISELTDSFESIEIFKDFVFGNMRHPRHPVQINTFGEFLYPNAENLAIVLYNLQSKHFQAYQEIIKNLKRVYERIERLVINLQQGTLQIYFEEKGLDSQVSATRLSDGTLRYLCLLAILCHPEPPPLICIEEPENGLHPDILPTIAELLKEASQRTQLIVTTHSDILVSAFSDMPEAVLVCEKDEDGTHFKRLEKDGLKEWLDEYSLGDLWLKGEIGGTRW